MIVEAQRFTKRRIVNMSFYSQRGLSVVKNPKDWSYISNDALSNLGAVGYSWLDVCYVGFREFMSKWFNVKYRNFHGEICSEYVAKLIGFEETAISPQRLYEKLISVDRQSHKLEIK